MSLVWIVVGIAVVGSLVAVFTALAARQSNADMMGMGGMSMRGSRASAKLSVVMGLLLLMGFAMFFSVGSGGAGFLARAPILMLVLLGLVTAMGGGVVLALRMNAQRQKAKRQPDIPDEIYGGDLADQDWVELGDDGELYYPGDKPKRSDEL
jgi:hypothetical protein